jgi:ribosomal protein S8E
MGSKKTKERNFQVDNSFIHSVAICTDIKLNNNTHTASVTLAEKQTSQMTRIVQITVLKHHMKYERTRLLTRLSKQENYVCYPDSKRTASC